MNKHIRKYIQISSNPTLKTHVTDEPAFPQSGRGSSDMTGQENRWRVSFWQPIRTA
jgi:hypothetical protein